MNTRLLLSNNGSILAKLKAKPIFIQQICEAQKCDTEILQCELNSDSDYQIGADDYLMFRNRICIPKNSELIQKILHEAHSGCLSIHLGSTKMYSDLKQLYETRHFLVCIEPVFIPKWKWDRVTIDFISGLPLSLKKKDAIWVVVDLLIESAHFILVRIDYSPDRSAKLYIAEIVRLHGVPRSEIYIAILEEIARSSGYEVKFSTAFHPQTDGQSERVIQILEDMLRCCVLEFEGNWEKILPLVEFAYNNSFQSSIKMAPYEALYGGKCRTPLYWTELSEKKSHRVNLTRETEEKVKAIRDNLKAASDRQKSYADL
ncbi:DNA/RNA polymerases superfamily protein [Gossypium australe]|uniref:DNA/RNA polymerases superfamily protein n=1 Tax=Gossypium australe TaxID=47621 RepID=A0A5B6WRM0_9ROSI|nr:DNA/RNA polymerases superfamily protein [Gossypium australe]